MEKVAIIELNENLLKLSIYKVNYFFNTFITWTTERMHKNTPNAIFNILLGKMPARSAPQMEKIIPLIIIYFVPLRFKKPFL